MMYNQHSQPYGYLYDDWEDEELVSRDRTVTPQTSDRQYKLFRPCWGYETNAPSPANGNIELLGDGERHEILHPSFKTTGTWEVTANMNGATAGALVMIPFTNYEQESYLRFVVNAGADYVRIFTKPPGGSLNTAITTSAPDLTVEHTYQVKCDEDKNLELLIDGNSVGTGSYSFESATGLLRLRGDGLDTTTQVSEFKVF